MKNLFKDTEDILSAEKTLKTHFNIHTDQLHNIGSLPISQEDCSFLLKEIIRLRKENTSISFFENISLSILVTLTFAYKYESSDPLLRKKFAQLVKNLPQHHFKFYINIISNAVDDYGIDNFGLNYTSYEGLKNIITLHANNSYSNEYCA